MLVVDDQPNMRRLLKTYLTASGYEVTEASNGFEGLQVIERRMPSLIMLDLSMPGMDGRQFARELNARGIRIPTVVVSGSSESRQVAREIGAAHLAKPFTDAQFNVALARVGCVGQFGPSLCLGSRW